MKMPTKKVVLMQTTDRNGAHWEKEGDFGVVAVGIDQYINGKKQEPDVEVDFTATDPKELSFLVATMLLILRRSSPKIAEDAITLYKSKI